MTLAWTFIVFLGMRGGGQNIMIEANTERHFMFWSLHFLQWVQKFEAFLKI